MSADTKNLFISCFFAMSFGITLGKHGCRNEERREEAAHSLIGVQVSAPDDNEPKEKPVSRPRKKIFLKPGMMYDPETQMVIRVPIEKNREGTLVGDLMDDK